MTKEEAIEDLLRHYTGESTDMAIKALEAWDKVIEEIESQQKFNIECDGESDLGMAIQIIKKHLGEVDGD